MRHGKKFNHLGRKKGHRKAMLSNMACSLIEHKRINTTVAKAKALRGFVEPLITKAKTDSTHSRRTAFKYLQSKDAVGELFREVAPKVADRPGGYTRIIRTGYRLGDNAEMCMIELVDFNELYTNEKSKKTTRRSRRGGGGAKAEVAAETTEEVVAEVEETAEVAAEETVEAKEETSATEETLAEEPKAEEAPAEETPAEETAEPEAKAEESSEEKNDDDEESSEEK
jgi:large subunit ribosomal protein L17